ncbi:MAG: zinc ribbon domain-containing protein [Lachnospiraceae bacterium]|nr:zinc ribbon domain-containing protein [Lachnospiraceae bacterium]
MNCPNCGGQISVTDEVCPYCGSPNQTREKQKADKKVRAAEAKASLTKPLAVFGTVLLLNIIAAVIVSNAYSAGLDVRRARNEARATEIEAEFKSYLDDKDYLLADSYYANGGYYSVSTMKPYRRVADALSYYSSIFFDIAPDRPNDYNSDGVYENCGNVARDLHSLYEVTDLRMADAVPTEYAETALNDIIREAEVMVAATYHLTDEETAGLMRLKESEIADLLKKAYIRYDGSGVMEEGEE